MTDKLTDDAADAVLAMELEEVVCKRVLQIVDANFDVLFRRFCVENPDRVMAYLSEANYRDKRLRYPSSQHNQYPKFF